RSIGCPTGPCLLSSFRGPKEAGSIGRKQSSYTHQCRSVSSSRDRNHLGKQPLSMLEMRIITLTISAGGVDSRKIEFEFELDFVTVKAHFARSLARKLLSERHWNSNCIFCSEGAASRARC